MKMQTRILEQFTIIIHHISYLENHIKSTNPIYHHIVHKIIIVIKMHMELKLSLEIESSPLTRSYFDPLNWSQNHRTTDKLKNDQITHSHISATQTQ